MKTKIAIALLALPLLAAPSFAWDRPRGEPAVSPKLTIGEVDARVRENGYPSVRGIELRRDGNYEVKAVDAENRRVELRVDGNTGVFVAGRTGSDDGIRGYGRRDHRERSGHLEGSDGHGRHDRR